MKEEKTNQQIHDELQKGLKPGQVRLHNKFHPTRWKKGFAQYVNHQPFEQTNMEVHGYIPIQLTQVMGYLFYHSWVNSLYSILQSCNLDRGSFLYLSSSLSLYIIL